MRQRAFVSFLLQVVLFSSRLDELLLQYLCHTVIISTKFELGLS